MQYLCIHDIYIILHSFCAINIVFPIHTVNSSTHNNTIQSGSLHLLFADLIMEYNWPCNCHKNGQVYLTLQYDVNQNNAAISLFRLATHVFTTEFAYLPTYCC